MLIAFDCIFPITIALKHNQQVSLRNVSSKPFTSPRREENRFSTPNRSSFLSSVKLLIGREIVGKFQLLFNQPGINLSPLKK